jgi:hypothetical protein
VKGENLEKFAAATGMPASMIDGVKQYRLGMEKCGDTWTCTERFGALTAVNKFKYNEEFEYTFKGRIFIFTI